MPAKRQVPAGGKAGGGRAAKRPAANKRQASANADVEDGEAVFLESDDEGRGKQQKAKRPGAVAEEDEDEEVQETAEEKRLRLAKEYLANLQATMEEDEDATAGRMRKSGLRGVTGGSDEEGDEDEEAAGLSLHDKLAARLKVEAGEVAGRVQRRIARTVLLPPSYPPSVLGRPQLDSSQEQVQGEVQASIQGASWLKRGHRLPATAVALSTDERTCWTVSKDGALFKWDIETGTRTRLYRPGEQRRGSAAAGASGSSAAEPAADGPEWVRRGHRTVSRLSLNAVAVSSDGALLAVGGGDRKVYAFDARSGAFLQAFPGHRDAITALSFREGTHTLFSGSADRTVKLWSLDDRAYMDTLFGHQAEVLALDVLRAERAVSTGADRSCRVWKVPEESQLIFKHASPGSSLTLDACRYVTGTEWVTGSSDGGVQLWTQLKRKPIAAVKAAHGPGALQPSAAAAAAAAGSIKKGGGVQGASAGMLSQPRVLDAGGGPLVPDVTGWVQSLAVARHSDLVASGAADGCVRLWEAVLPGAGSNGALNPVGALPARGFVNGLALGRSGRLVVAALGQEPRLGRWAVDKVARNGVLVHRIELSGQ